MINTLLFLLSLLARSELSLNKFRYMFDREVLLSSSGTVERNNVVSSSAHFHDFLENTKCLGIKISHTKQQY